MTMIMNQSIFRFDSFFLTTQRLDYTMSQSIILIKHESVIYSLVFVSRSVTNRSAGMEPNSFKGCTRSCRVSVSDRIRYENPFSCSFSLL